MDKIDLNALVDLYGIETSYLDAWGQPSQVSESSQAKLLNMMGVDVSDGEAVDDMLAFSYENTWTSLLQPTLVLKNNEPFSFVVTLPINDATSELTGTLTTEESKTIAFDFVPIDGLLVDVNQSGDIEIHRYLITLSDEVQKQVGLGYHTLDVNFNGELASSKVIMAPERCFTPDMISEGKKPWGFSVQLYSLRSQSNWGMGDFGDLVLLVESAAKLGVDFIGLNPIHTLFPSLPESCSPYGPSSRRWINYLYLDVTQVTGFHCAEVQDIFSQPSFQNELTRLKESEYIDYAGVAALKLPILKTLFNYYKSDVFCNQPTEKAKFDRFVEKGGKSLETQVSYDALVDYYHEKDKNCTSWHGFPNDLAECDSSAVREFINNHKSEIEFYQFLQWQAQSQLEMAQDSAVNAGMSIGLYRDLAVGVSEGSAEVWGNRDLYCTDGSIGAPPDVLGPLGQDWGLPPMHPQRLYEQGYQPIIDLFSSNMQFSGALRIDHVMALLRLWWVPKGDNATEGGYVYYPVDDLLAILALESHRNESLIIGEDLGTVPDEIREKLSASGIYSYRVFFFEQADDGGFFSPSHYPEQSMATLTTHDMPTLIGFWHCLDLEMGKSLGLYPDENVLQNLYAQRHSNKQSILDTLHGHGSVGQDVNNDVNVTGMSEALNVGLHKHLAAGSSRLLSFQLEDWLHMDKPVNVPGTFKEYPNWRRKLSVDIEELFASSFVQTLAKNITHVRQ
ncbi:4-alpha-glucanotransferase [Alteromonas sp. 5E99-2]|uniref:4-alpha-glucanotransferase n=1 Tax=Alteromonas sp. 5E99-2 TaxID=2817683 RepID=UPI001A99615C|nr:4-alpha-glucanotransferase [Alteromonas sp. 5E99-2]MBO1256217.1 4-alpha-glucanotransferase [Alteromonas sp. 5E99-2]